MDLTEISLTLVFLHILSSFRVYGLQQFLEKPQDKDVIKGHTVTMRCVIENREGRIQWSKDGLMLGYQREIPGFSRYSYVVNTQNDRTEFNLQIVNVRLDDDAEYHCQVAPAPNNPGLMAGAKLQVLVPPNEPKIVGYENGSTVEVLFTQSVLQLTCVAKNGRPAAMIKWLRNGVEITEGVEYTTEPIESDKRENAQSVLLIQPKYPDDNGAVYTCQAINNALVSGPLQVMVVLSVQYPPGPPVITGYKTDTAVRINDTVVMTCTSSGGNPLAQVAWFRNSMQVDFSYTVVQREEKTVNEMVIEVEQSDNDAVFRCEAWNVVNTDNPLSESRKLVVHFPPKSVKITGTKEAKVNETVTLTCTSSNSNPAATISWIPQGTTIVQDKTRVEASPDGGYITISEINVTLTNRQASAIYTCSATNNQLGVTVADTVTVGVLYPPNPPTIYGYNEGDSIRAGQLLRLTCRSLGGNPPATLQWYKDDQLITTGVNNKTIGNRPISELVLPTEAADNNALYKCLASNRATPTPLEAVKKLTVHFPPSAVNITSIPVKGRSGEKLTLICQSSSSNPAAMITWIYKDKVIQGADLGLTAAENGGKSSKNKLEILPTYQDHETVYGCRATNLVLQEAVHDGITLDILFKPVFSPDLDVIVISEGESRVINLTARANPSEASYTLLRNNLTVSPGDISSFTLEKGELTVSGINRNDGGSFTVIATNSEGVTQHDFTINVQYPAEIYEGNVVEAEVGGSADLKCLVRANPMIPNMVTWSRSSFDMSRALEKYEEGVGTLYIETIEKTDSGMFTCRANNGIEPDATREVELVVKCNHISINSMVTWSRSSFDMSRALEKYEEGVGTLYIETIEKTDSGMFTCRANNGIEPDATREVELVVKFSPLIDQSREYQKAASEAGLTGRLICRAEGAPSVSFKWQKDGIVIEPNPTVGKYEIQQKVTDTIIHYENVLLVKTVQKEDYGIYTCIVTNEKGEARFNIRFDETTKPDAPYDIQFVNATHNSITIKWKKAFNGGLDESFRVRYEEVDRPGSFVQVDVQPRDSTIYTVRGLALGTEYELTVMAFNTLGNSEYQPIVVRAKTSNLKPADEAISTETDKTEDTPVMIILGVCIVGVFLLVFNIVLILFFVRRRKKRMENGSDTTSHTNTIELYGPSKETALYPMTPSDESRSYGTYDKNMDDDFSDDFKSYEDDDLKRVFLPPPEYGEVTYSHNNMDSPTFEHRHPVYTDAKYPYNGSDTDSCRKSPWRYEDVYRTKRGKGSFDNDHDYHSSPLYEPNGHAGGFTRPKSITEISERSSRPSSRGAPLNKTPPPPPVRSSSKGAAGNVPPLPARNYGSQEDIPRYVPPPGSLSSFGSNANVIANPNYDGPGLRTPSPRQPTDPNDDMRGYLV